MSNDKTIIYVVRHGESEGNVAAWKDGTLPLEPKGGLGTPLTDEGKRQAEELSKLFKDINFAAVFSSDLARASETAEIIAAAHDLPVTTRSSIRERNWGATITGAIRKEIEQALKDLNDEERLAYKYAPDGESGLDAIKRFTDFLQEVAPAYKGKKILVVNHGNVMRSFLIKQGFASHDELPSGSLLNTGYFILETDGKDFEIKETFGVNKSSKTTTEE